MMNSVQLQGIQLSCVLTGVATLIVSFVAISLKFQIAIKATSGHQSFRRGRLFEFRFVGCLPAQAHQSTLITSEGGRRTNLNWSSHSQALLVTDNGPSPSSHWFYPLGGSCAASLCKNTNENLPHSISSQPETSFAGFPCLRGPAFRPLG
jgi:hypothetical protein